MLRQAPTFYPAEAGLGFVLLAGRQFRNAEPRFGAVVAANSRYLPAWIGRAEALLGLGQDREAIAALERVLVLDPRRESARTRLEFLKLRATQTLVDGARRARAAGRLAEAERQLEAAVTDSPSSAVLVRELGAVELAAGKVDEAEGHARRAIQLEPREGSHQAFLGDVLEAGRKYRDASTAYARAGALDARPEWRERMLDLREKAEAALLPASFAKVTTAPTVTRGEVAAFIGIHLDTIIEQAPRRVTDVATDIRTHWAANWIVPVTRAGVMTILPNHTFQPAAVVRRADLASIVSALLRIALTSRRADLATWQAARPRFTDLAPTHVAYPVAALAVAAGAMAVDGDGGFAATRAVTGRELDIAVRRVGAIAVPGDAR